MKQAREQRGLKAEEAALLIGVAYTTYRGAESGRKPGPSILDFLERAFDSEAVGIRKAWSDGPSAEQRWLGAIWVSGTRDYNSIDDVRLQIEGDAVSIRFHRLHPLATDRGLRWSGAGIVDPMQNLLIHFTSDNSDGAYTSSGVLSLRPVVGDGLTSRVFYYKGDYLRPIRAIENDRRSCNLYKRSDFPNQFMPYYAALDLDNTLFQGWSLFEWADSARASGLADIRGVRRDFANMRDAYTRGSISHDELASTACMRYTDVLQSNGPSAVRETATAFARDALRQKKFMPFAFDLVESLRSRLVAPVIITGAPIEIAAALATVLHVEEVHAYDSQLGNVDAGTSAEKVRTITELGETTRRDLQLAAGDSLSDLAMLERAPSRVVASSLLRHPEALSITDGAFAFNSGTSGDAIAAWLNEVPGLGETDDLVDE